MKSIFARALATGTCALLLASTGPVSATSIPSVRVDALFHEADVVAIVRILSGDSEHYPETVYKAQVINALKGVTPEEKVFLGPSDGYGIGSEYLVFLKRSEAIAPKENSEGVSYGNIGSFYLVMYAGYSVMPVGYTCVFDGKDIAQQCDYSIQLNPEQIILPKYVRTFPEKPADAVTNYKKWVRRDGLVSFLQIESLKQQPVVLPRAH